MKRRIGLLRFLSVAENCIVLSLAVLLFVALPAWAGINEWTSIGPGGGDIRALAIVPSAPNIIYAANGGVIKSVNGGGNWVQLGGVPDNAAVWTVAIDPASANTIYAAGNGLYKSTDGGNSWSNIGSGLSSGGPDPAFIRAIAIDPSAPNTIYAGLQADFPGAGSGIFKTTDGGQNWIAVNSGLPIFVRVSTLLIDPLSPSTIYTGTSQGVYKSVNGGNTWGSINIGFPDIPNVLTLAIHPSAPDTIYAGTNENGTYKSADGGAQWYPINGGQDNPTVMAIAIDPSRAATLYAATYGESGGAVYKSTDGGQNWTRKDAGLYFVAQAFAIDPSCPTTVYVGAQGGAFKSLNGGTSWRGINKGLVDGTGIGPIALDPFSPTTIYGGTLQGFFKTTDAGETWSVVKLPIAGNVGAAPYVDPSASNVLYAATGSGVFKSTNGGGTWYASNSGLTSCPDVIAIDPSNSNVIYVGGGCTPHNPGGVYKSTDGGGTWVRTNFNDAYNTISALVIDPSTPTTLYAGSWHGGVHKSTDGGINWTAINTGIGDADVTGLAIDPSAPNTIYVTTTGWWFNATRGIYKSTNGGLTWAAVNAGIDSLDLDTLAMDPAAPSNVYVGGWGGVYRSTNGGQSWSAINTSLNVTGNGIYGLRVTSLAVAPSAATTVYATLMLGGIYSYTISANGTSGTTSTPSSVDQCLVSIPVVGAINAPIAPVEVYSAITASADFSDAGSTNTHAAVWNWGDGTTSAGTVMESQGTGTVSDSHIYATAGVYTITLRVTNADGLSGSRQFQYVVVYDPNGGFVTGGGWITSPPGAYKPAADLTGKATFGFVSKYAHGASVPTGATEFQFKVANLNFHSTSYAWLVVNQNVTNAQFKGAGTINGEGSYMFMLWAADGTPDTFRLKIWSEDAAGMETVVYDNGVAQAISGGNITIHK